jgi:hypothetical protein
LIKPYWCHEITAEDRERFIQKRVPEVGSTLTVDAELRSLRLLCNIMEEWKHRPEKDNPGLLPKIWSSDCGMSQSGT